MPLGFVLLCARVLLPSKVHIIATLSESLYCFSGFIFISMCTVHLKIMNFLAMQTVCVISSGSQQPQKLFHNY